MKIAILILSRHSADRANPRPTTEAARAAARPIPASHGDDVRGYNDTPQLPGQKWKVHDMERPRAAQSHARPVRRAPPRPPTPSCCSTARISRTGCRAARRPDPGAQVEGRKRLPGNRPAHRQADHEGEVRRLPAARRMDDSQGGHRRRTGPRQQRRGTDDALRNPGAGIQREPDLCRWSRRRDVRNLAAAGQPVPPAGRMERLRHHLRGPAIRRMANWSSRPISPFSSTAFWCRITRSSWAPPSGARSRNTLRTPPRSR